MYYTTKANERNSVYGHKENLAKPRLFSFGRKAKSDVFGLDISL